MENIHHKQKVTIGNKQLSGITHFPFASGSTAASDRTSRTDPVFISNFDVLFFINVLYELLTF